MYLYFNTYNVYIYIYKINKSNNTISTVGETYQQQGSHHHQIKHNNLLFVQVIKKKTTCLLD